MSAWGAPSTPRLTQPSTALPALGSINEGVRTLGARSKDSAASSSTGSATRAAGRAMTQQARVSADLGDDQPSTSNGKSTGKEEEEGFLTSATAKHLRRQVTQLHEERHESKKTLESLMFHTGEQAEKMERLESEAKMAKMALKVQEERLEQAESAGKVARRKLEEMEEAHKQLQVALSQREAEVQSLKAALDALRRESQESLEATLKGSQDEACSLREKLLEANAASERQSGELEELRERLRKSEQEAGSETSRLTTLLGGLTAEVGTLRTEGEALQVENVTLKGERGALQEQREALLVDKEALKAKLEEALKLKETQASHLEASLEEARQAAEARRAEAEEWAAEAETSKRLAEELEQRSRQLEEERALASSQCDTLRGEEAVLRGQLEMIGEQLEKVREAGNKSSTLHREVELLRSQLTKATQDQFDMRRKSEQDMQNLLEAKMADAINQKVELHICVPRTNLTYNNGPPLSANVADGLGKERIEQFLEREVFPHFEPLWARLDTMDVCPDGECKRVYSKKMLDCLTEAVRAYVREAQQPKQPPAAA